MKDFFILNISYRIMETINLVKIWSEWICEKNIQKMLNDAKKWEEKLGEKFLFLSSWSVKLWLSKLIFNQK